MIFTHSLVLRNEFCSTMPGKKLEGFISCNNILQNRNLQKVPRKSFFVKYNPDNFSYDRFRLPVRERKDCLPEAIKAEKLLP